MRKNVGKVSIRLALGILFLVALFSILNIRTTRSATVPTNLRVNGSAVPTNIPTNQPSFSWSSVGQQNWQIITTNRGRTATWNAQSTGSASCGGVVQIPQSDTITPPVVSNANNANQNALYYERGVVTNGSCAPTQYKIANLYDWIARIWDGSSWSAWVSGPAYSINNLPSPINSKNIAAASEAASANAYVSYAAPVTRTVDVPASGTATANGAALQAALNAAQPGDRIVLHTGTYQGVSTGAAAFTIPGGTSGTLSNPITLMAAAGENPLLTRGASSGSYQESILLIQNSGYWTFNGFILSTLNNVFGLNLGSSNHIRIENVRMEQVVPTTAVKMNALIGGGIAEDVVIDGGRYEFDTGAAIIDGGNKNLTIRNLVVGNVDQSSTNGTEGIIEIHGSGENILLENNIFYNFFGATNRKYIHLYKDTRGSRLTGNIFYKMKFPMVLQDSGNITVDHNIFDQNDAGLGDSTGGYNNVHHNVFSRILSSIWAGSLGTNTAKYNIFYWDSNRGSASAVGIPSGMDATNIAQSFSTAVLDSTINGLFMDPSNASLVLRDYRPRSTASQLIDKDDPPLYPVPVGGGTKIDIGAYESGAGVWPYAYQPQVVVNDPTPKITWTFEDHDNILIGPGTDFQTRYQVQIDTSPVFTSGGAWRPYIDSGAIAGGSLSYTVPDARPLTPGTTYYARIRNSDDSEPGKWGMWSYVYPFQMASIPGQPTPSAGSDVNTSSTANIILSGSATDSDGNMTGLSWSVAPSGCTVTQGMLTNNGSTASRSLTLSGCADNTYTATLAAIDPSASNTDIATVKKDSTAPAPVPIPVAALNGAQVNLTWSAASDPVAGFKDYQLWRSANGGAYASLGYITGTSYADTNTAPTTSYRYKLSTRDNFDNESAQGTASNQVTTGNIATFVLQQGVSPTTSYGGSEDTTLRGPTGGVTSCSTQSDQCWNRGGSTSMEAGNGTVTAGQVTKRMLVWFAIPVGTGANQVPSTASISSATLTLTCTGTGNGSAQTVRAYRALKPWIEGNGDNGVLTYAQSQSPANGGSSWMLWNGTSGWGTPGAANASNSGTHNTGSSSGFDRYTTAEASQTITTCANTPVDWDVTNAVAKWVLGAAGGGWENDGLVIAIDSATEGQAQSQKMFATSENGTASFRPKLTIVYDAGGAGGDTTPPTVSITAPPNNATVSGNTAVSAAASDNVGVAGVQFRLDGANLGAEDTASPYSYSWDTTTASNGSHSLTAVARDAAGNTATSPAIAVTVSNAGSGCGTTPLPGSPEGFGSGTTGGAGQPVICVTNLADSGAGSLRAALTNVGASGARIYFSTSGTINIATKLQLSAKNNVTIDGSTAPSPGIIIKGGELEIRNSNNVIVRHLRNRETGDVITNAPGFVVWCTSGPCSNFWFDHLSVSRASDDPILIYENVSNVTISNSIVYDTLDFSVPSSPEAMNISGTSGGPVPDRVTVHHNVLTKNYERNPKIQGIALTPGTKPLVDIRNNIIHNWSSGGYGTQLRWGATGNIVKNVYRSATNPNGALEFYPPGAGEIPVNPAAVYTNGNDAQQANINTMGTSASPVGSAPAITEHTTADLRKPLGCNPLLDDVGALPRDAIDTTAIAAVVADVGTGSCIGGDTTPPTAPTNLRVTGVSQIQGPLGTQIAHASFNVLAVMAAAFRSIAQTIVTFFIQLGF